MSKLTKVQRQVLEQLRKAAAFERACFNNGSGEATMIRTDQIKERTRIYRDTWIIGRIDSLLEGREREWASPYPMRPLPDKNSAAHRHAAELYAFVRKCGAFTDIAATTHLAKTGSYSCFDSPGIVQEARELLDKVHGNTGEKA